MLALNLSGTKGVRGTIAIVLTINRWCCEKCLLWKLWRRYALTIAMKCIANPVGIAVSRTCGSDECSEWMFWCLRMWGAGEFLPAETMRVYVRYRCQGFLAEWHANVWRAKLLPFGAKLHLLLWRTISALAVFSALARFSVHSLKWHANVWRAKLLPFGAKLHLLLWRTISYRGGRQRPCYCLIHSTCLQERGRMGSDCSFVKAASGSVYSVEC